MIVITCGNHHHSCEFNVSHEPLYLCGLEDGMYPNNRLYNTWQLRLHVLNWTRNLHNMRIIQSIKLYFRKGSYVLNSWSLNVACCKKSCPQNANSNRSILVLNSYSLYYSSIVCKHICQRYSNVLQMFDLVCMYVR